MSCITIIGNKKLAHATGPALPQSSPEWTASKAKRLMGMALSSRDTTRAVAAAHPRLPESMLWEFMTDKSLLVRHCAVQNTATTREMLTVWLEDKDPGIRAYARMRLEERT